MGRECTEAVCAISMADSYPTLKARIAGTHEGMLENLKATLITTQSEFRHTAQAGTAENIDGVDGIVSVRVSLYFVSDKANNAVYVGKNGGMYHTTSVPDKALVYDEGTKVNVTACAVGNGTATAHFDGMIAGQKSDSANYGAYIWSSKYTLSAVPAENHRFVTWLYTEDGTTTYKESQQNTPINPGADRAYTAYFVENQAPVISSNAPKELKDAVRNKIYCNFDSSVFSDVNTVAVGGKDLYQQR